MIKDVERLVKRARESRQNRAYYEKYFDITDLRKAGLVQDYDAKTRLDLVELEDSNRSELVYMYGFDQSSSSYFELTLSVVSLYKSGFSEPPSKWRLLGASLQLVLESSSGWTRYTYEYEQLVDYETKRLARDKHEHSNIYKVGSLSLETVQPFSLSRLLLNGPVLVEQIDHSGVTVKSELKPVRLSLWGHPTSDKFDYSYQFDTKFTAEIVSKSLAKGGGGKNHGQAKDLLDLALEDRFDQPLMFEGQLEDLAGAEPVASPFFMWGAKVKKFSQANEQLTRASDDDDARECLFAWTECGQQIHLSRPKNHGNLIYGLAHASLDYASPLQELSLHQESEMDFDELNSFIQLSNNHTIHWRAFQKKQFKLEFLINEKNLPNRPIKINGYSGRALCVSLDLGARIRQAQDKLNVMNIHDHELTRRLAEERLLGGKGQSLVNLARLVHYERRLSGAQVPRGLVVTSKAYESWLASDFVITSSLRELDAARRVLAARSALRLDPLDREHTSAADAQRELKVQCETIHAKLIECLLPDKLAQQIREQLLEIFGNLDSRTFAVRSSCVGEDSLETSAAGQMKTLLGVSGLSAITRAIVECWLSQFTLEALTYKSQNGLRFNLPMAVVVQELIQCHAAGVAATCDPLTGNKSRLEITANLGLGEGVVAGRETDTIRMTIERDGPIIQEKLAEGGKLNCCLSDEQIRALGNLLIELRNSSDIVEREVEWGITLAKGSRQSSSSSSSSSSDDSDTDSPPTSGFEIHLLQSRPLTHLQRLSGREILHELDYGMSCPLDLVSRANVGEVMPGALSPLYLSWFNPIATSYLMRKPFEEAHTRCPYVADNMTFHGQMVSSMLTYSDSAKRFAVEGEKEAANSRAVLYSMIGTTLQDQLENEEEREKFMNFCLEKVHPLKPEVKMNMGLIMAVELAIFPTVNLRAKRELRSFQLTEDLIPLERLFERLQTSNDLTDLILYQQITKLYERLLTNTKPLAMGWLAHIMGSFMSIAFNVITMKLLSEQPEHSKGSSGPRELTSTEILNDFTVLMRGRRRKSSSSKTGKQTESGDIGRLLSELLESFADENRLEQMRAMSVQELYDFLKDKENCKQFRCCQLFGDFMAKNGHRAWKEFCMSTQTWGDTPSAIVKLLAARLKSYTPEGAHRERARQEEQEREHQVKLAQVLEKIQSNRLLLLKWALPKARKNAIRREGTKSLIIRAIHKYRLAFRHLGGLLCLAGLLPSADLIFQLTIEEIDEMMRKCCSPKASAGARDNVMPRLLYKARRRQQKARLVDKITMPRPTLSLREMIQVIEDQTSENPVIGKHEDVALNNVENRNALVRGLISCAGCVTGRACVIASLDEADQIEPNDILITYSIDISWSVHFYSLAGIVTEVGGIVSHGAVVAREYGLPTLCTAVGACSNYKTGQRVTLDANKGICYLADEQSTEQQN